MKKVAICAAYLAWPLSVSASAERERVQLALPEPEAAIGETSRAAAPRLGAAFDVLEARERTHFYKTPDLTAVPQSPRRRGDRSAGGRP